MKYRVNDNCIACGLCTELCPEVFHMTDEPRAEAADVDTALESAAEAMESCPVSAIEEQ